MDLSKLKDGSLHVDVSDTFQFKSIIFRLFLGMLMGASDAVPGYSGGTTLSISNVYDKMIITAKNVLKPDVGNSRLKCLLWLMPFTVGWVGSIVATSILLKYLLYSWNMQAEVLIFFSSLCLFNIPTFLEVNRLKKQKLKRPKVWLWFSLGMILIVGAVAGIVMEGGIHFGEKGATPKWDWNKYGILLVAGGMIGGLVMLIPGGSGSMIIFIMGLYNVLHATVLAHPTKYILQVVIFWTSAFIGMSVSVFLSSFLLTNHKDKFSMFSLGMISASVVAVLVIVKPESYQHLKNAYHIIGACSAAFLSLMLSIFVLWRAKIANKKHIIEENEEHIIQDDLQRGIAN